MNKIICLINQKGGVGKTTSALAISSLLSQLANKKVLLIDLDPQGNTSSSTGLTRERYKNSNIYHALMGIKSIKECIYETKINNLKIVPADINLSAAELELISEYAREKKLEIALEPILDDFDHIIIDSSPALGLLTINALSATQDCIIPLQCEAYAFEGFSNLQVTIEKIQKNVNKNLVIKGVLLTMVNRRNNLHKDLESHLRERFGSLVFTNVIPSNIKLAECAIVKESILEHAPKSSGCLAYIALIKELAPDSAEMIESEYNKKYTKVTNAGLENERQINNEE